GRSLYKSPIEPRCLRPSSARWPHARRRCHRGFSTPAAVADQPDPRARALLSPERRSLSRARYEERMMDAIEMLTKDHNKVRELFAKFNGGSGVTGMVRRTIGSVSPQEKRRAREQVCKELEMHTLIEETVFYPAVRALGDRELDDQIREALEE